MATDAIMSRGTGLLVLEVVNSNPNGDPDQESDPRTRLGDIGEISPVSLKRKLRDLMEDVDGPIWQELQRTFPVINKEHFQILEQRGRKREEIAKLDTKEFQKKFWDARIFGSTFLQGKAESTSEDKDTAKTKGKQDTASHITTGVVQFGMGISVAPVDIQRHTLTNKAGVEGDKDRGMAPLAYRVVQHGVYVMPFYVNPSLAHKSACTQQDIDVLLKLIPYAYSQTASCIRPDVRVRRAWYIEHKSPLGSCPEHELIDALQPVKRTDSDKPSRTWSEYDVPSSLPAELCARVARATDLVAPQAAGA